MKILFECWEEYDYGDEIITWLKKYKFVEFFNKK